MSRHLYRYHAVVRLDPANAPSGEWSNMDIYIQIPADSLTEATQKAAAVGKQEGLLLVGPVNL